MTQLTQKQRQHSQAVVAALQKHADEIQSILPTGMQKTEPFVFDLSENNQVILEFDLHQPLQMDAYMKEQIVTHGAQWGIGKYDEDRVIYRFGEQFNNGVDEPRSLHLAYDLWAPEGTAIYAPLAGTVHSFADNNLDFDYGGTIILQHELDGTTFYTLYGHLSRASLQGMSQGKSFNAGEQIGSIGNTEENGHWATHLHFEIITDMLGKKGDFPGVAKPSEREFWLTICPDPNLIVQI